MIVNTNAGNIELPTNVKNLKDPDAVTIFTLGHCHSLAIAIHKLTGWELVGLVGFWNTNTCPAHVVVRTPDGKLLDINGLNDKHWEAYDKVYNFDPATLTDYRKADPDMAMPFAIEVLQQYCPDYKEMACLVG